VNTVDASIERNRLTRMKPDPKCQIRSFRTEDSLKIMHQLAHLEETIAGKFTHDDSVILVWRRHSTYSNIADGFGEA